MLSRSIIRHRCRSFLHHPFTQLNPQNPLILTNPTSLISSQSLPLEPAVASSIVSLKIPPLFEKLGVKDLTHLGLSCSRVDEVIGYLRTSDPDSAIELLKNEHGFRHSKACYFVVAHVLASQRRLKLLRSIFLQMLREEGSGSGPSLCELLSVDFKDWEANAIVWDMLAFAYSRSEMVHDALFVIAKMKDLNFQPSILTYNSLLYNLRHFDIMWDVYNDIKESGIHESKQTNSILIDGLCKQSLIQEAVSRLHGTDQLVLLKMH